MTGDRRVENGPMVIRSMSGQPIEDICDEDRIWCVIAGVEYNRTSNLDGKLVVGLTTFDILRALTANGFEVRRIKKDG